MDDRPRRRRKKAAVGKPISGLITAVLIVSVVIVLGLMIWVFSDNFSFGGSTSPGQVAPQGGGGGGSAMESSVAMDRRTAIAVKQMAASIATD